MSSLAVVLDELANVVRDAVNDDWDIQVEPWYVVVPQGITIDMFPADPPTFDELRGMGELEGALAFTVRARVDSADSDARRDVLLSLMDIEDDNSIVLAITDDQTLNGNASFVEIQSATGLSAFPRLDGLGAYLGFQYTVLVGGIHS